MAAPILNPAVSTVPGVILALNEKLSTLTWPTLAGNDQAVSVYDGMTGPSEPANYVTIAAGSGAVKMRDAGTWTQLQAPHREEAYSVGLEISCLVGGSDDVGDFGLSDAQRSSRANAFAIFATIQTAVRTDMRLTSVADPPGILWSSVAVSGIDQTGEDDPESQAGRACTLRVDFHVLAILNSPTGVV